MIPIINKIQKSWQKTLIHLKEKKIFFKNPDLIPAQNIKKQLQLNPFMSLSELQQALQLLESINKSKTNQTLISQQKKQRRLVDIDIINKYQGQKISVSDPMLIDWLMETHALLLDSLERGLMRVNDEISVREVQYTPDELNQSQPFLHLKTSSTLPHAKDKSNILMDAYRDGFKLDGKIFRVDKNIDTPREQQVRNAIELFTGDKINDPLSRANKMFNFGGQFLAAIVGEEFANKVQLEDKTHYRLEPGFTDGSINWRKDSGQIYADVNLKIYSVNSVNMLDKNELPKTLVMGSDNVSLVEVKDTELAKIAKRVSNEKKHTKPADIIPIATINTTVKVDAVKAKDKIDFEMSEAIAKLENFLSEDKIEPKDSIKPEIESVIEYESIAFNRSLSALDCKVNLNAEELTHSNLIKREEKSKELLADIVKGFNL